MTTYAEMITPGDECSIEGCSRPRRTRGWCGTHYERWRRTGSTAARPRYASLESAFIAQTEPLPWSGCLIWTGTLAGGDRYGQLSASGQRVSAHRYAWEREHGLIPEGMMVDHRYHCHTLCCEASHLRLATVAENASNRRGPQRKSVTGVRGVSPHRGGYRATVRAGGRQHNLGTHATIEEARQAVESGRAALFGDFAGRS